MQLAGLLVNCQLERNVSLWETLKYILFILCMAKNTKSRTIGDVDVN